MRPRSIMKFRPGLEQFEAKQLLSAGSLTTHAVNTKDGSRALALHSADTSGAHEAANDIATSHAGPRAQRSPPSCAGGSLWVPRVPRHQHAVADPLQAGSSFPAGSGPGTQPVPGQVYNVSDVTVKNGTSQTFTASNGFTVRMTNQPRSFGGFPVLTGNEQWKPGQILVFYVLTKKYYPVSFVAGGFQFDLGGRSSTAIPGPAGIFLRLKYDPATFAGTLNWIVAYGQGNQVGQGAIWSAQHINQRDRRREDPAPDFAGHF